ncbi:flavin reductase family protein [Paenibacillus turpanensis]|uniref:flavin reductase family protein n=1 Tax=Paenibacillus turpanensis TaxID=2689078 RepID=UPI00140A5A93|nr:flavin reductase family protein [Paenibacillus turpanensis]
MLRIDPESQSERENYQLLISSVIPRPVALVTTLTAEGVLNAAPFSYFSIVSAKPPMVSVAVQRRGSEPKDTARNAMQIGEFVVHVTDEANVELANRTAANFGPDESEVAAAGLTAVPSNVVRVPGVAEARIRMECVLEHAFPLGGAAAQPACDLLIGRVVCFHVAEEICVDGRIDPHRLRPVSRLAGSSYGKLGELFELERPQ